MGALLALELAIRRPQDVAGVALYGTTFRYDGWAVPRRARLSFLLPWGTRLGIGRRRVFMERFPYGIKNERIRQWVVGPMLAGDSAASGLPGNPWPSLAELVRLSRHVRRRLAGVRAPCLVVHSTDDDIAGLGNVTVVTEGVAAPVELLLLDDSYHMVSVDQQRDVVIARSAAFFARIAGVDRSAAPVRRACGRGCATSSFQRACPMTDRNLARGLFLIAIALAFGIGALRYSIGQFSRAGPGLFPLLVGSLLLLVGIASVVRSRFIARVPLDFKLRNIAIVLTSLAGFAVISQYVNMILGIVFMVFCASFAAPTAYSIARNAKIAAGLVAVAFGFQKLLGLNLPLY